MSLLLFFLLYFALTFAWRSVAVYRETGINPLVLPSRDDAYGYVGRAFKVVIGAIAAYSAILAFAPALAARLGLIEVLAGSVAFAVGWFFLWASLAWLVVSQSQMGSSWRIGIDEAGKTTLVRGGLFSISRNPIFLGMRFTMLGLFLVTPSAITLAIVVAGELLMQVQVRLEESHLLSMHGEEYRSYMENVRRWL